MGTACRVRKGVRNARYHGRSRQTFAHLTAPDPLFRSYQRKGAGVDITRRPLARLAFGRI